MTESATHAFLITGASFLFLKPETSQTKKTVQKTTPDIQNRGYGEKGRTYKKKTTNEVTDLLASHELPPAIS